MTHELSIVGQEDGLVTALCSCGQWEDTDVESDDNARLLFEQHVEQEEAA